MSDDNLFDDRDDFSDPDAPRSSARRADDDLFEDLDQFNDLDETPPFEFDDDITVPDFGAEEGGVSRTFKVVGALMVIGVVAIVALIVLFALNNGDKLSEVDRANTSVAKTNVAIEFQYNATLTALASIEQASQTAVRNAELAATDDALAAQTQSAIQAQTQEALRVADLTATADAELAQTQQAADQAATQGVADSLATANAAANRIFGVVADQQGQTVGGVTLKLYRDDGDGVFTPSDRILAPAEQPQEGSVEALTYGVTVEGALANGEASDWTFPGSAGDVVTISAEAADTAQMDLFVELRGPNDATLAGDDDSGEGNNALINDFELPDDGEYTIRVSSVAGPGDYKLTLNLSASAQGASVGYQPNVSGQGSNGYALIRLQATATPTLGDTLVDIIETTAEGEFDFGSLDPGIYWLELEYDTLPPELQALIPVGQPLVVQVIVPISGEVEFVLGDFLAVTGTPLPTITWTPTSAVPTNTPLAPTATLSAIDQTATAYSLQTRTPIPITPSETPGVGIEGGQVTAATEVLVTPSATALPETGFFSDVTGSGGVAGTSGLTILAIAAAGLLAVVFVARRLRTA